jgi:pSer/pThr/pTyr-binding forkhead associated (FHA) protein
MIHDDEQLPDGPEIEHGPRSGEIQHWLQDSHPGGLAPRREGGGPAAWPSAPAHFAPEDYHAYRPSWRPPVPVLTVLDDGASETGEQYRLRREMYVIGRSSGDILIPNDPWVSARHAEIQRLPWQGGFQWHLRDCGSSNGTFVRCTRAILHETAVVVLGTRRFRLQNPLRAPVVEESDGSTQELKPVPQVVWPSLVEVTGEPAGLNVPLRRDMLTLGRTGAGVDVEIDDPLLAYRHATLKRQKDGTWLITAEPTRNGVWISTTNVALTSNCRFRCGEQQFWFVIP